MKKMKMLKFHEFLEVLKVKRFMNFLFPDPDVAARASEIAEALLDARSLRLSSIARTLQHRSGDSLSEHGAYKRIQRFLKQFDPREVLWELFPEDAPFVIADITDVPRPQAKKTEYVGKLKDRTRGFWVLVLAAPVQGRAIPFGMVTFSSKTLRDEGTSRNRMHHQAIFSLQDLVGDRPIVMDREFSYTELLRHLKEGGLHFVVRLRLGSHGPGFVDREGRKITLPPLARGERVVIRGVRYRGEVEVNVIGVWEKGYREPLWVMTTLDPEEGLRLYRERMKIEAAFRDLKSLLGLGKIMSKKREMMEKLVSFLLLVYGMILLIGAEARKELLHRARRWLRFSGPFILLHQFNALSQQDWESIVERVHHAFLQSLYPQPHQCVRTHG